MLCQIRAIAQLQLAKTYPRDIHQNRESASRSYCGDNQCSARLHAVLRAVAVMLTCIQRRLLKTNLHC